MLLAIIATCLLIVVPQLCKYYVYHVISPSMSPEIPVGSIVYVKPTAPEDIEDGDVIAFISGDTIITHRVVKNYIVEGKFTTKGDANPTEDENPVLYSELVGKVVWHYPWLGQLFSLYSTSVGKFYIVLFAACGAMMNILANRLRARIEESEDTEVTEL